MSSDKFLYPEGSPNPDRLGFIPLRYSAGERPDPAEIDRAAHILGQPVREVDSEGYELEITGAAVEGGAGCVAYVQSRAQDFEGAVDVDFQVHLREPNGTGKAWPIETYNPYFGCDIRFFKWVGAAAILIYREKHHSYACKIAAGATPTFEKIKDYWTINSNILAYWGWKDSVVSRLTLPDLQPLPAISEEEARVLNVLPPKCW